VTEFEKASHQQNLGTSSSELFVIMKDLIMTNLAERSSQEFFSANVINCCSHINEESHKEIIAVFLELY
jgi:hypothetical protein